MLERFSWSSSVSWGGIWRQFFELSIERFFESSRWEGKTLFSCFFFRWVFFFVLFLCSVYLILFIYFSLLPLLCTMRYSYGIFPFSFFGFGFSSSSSSSCLCTLLLGKIVVCRCCCRCPFYSFIFHRFRSFFSSYHSFLSCTGIIYVSLLVVLWGSIPFHFLFFFF